MTAHAAVAALWLAVAGATFVGLFVLIARERHGRLGGWCDHEGFTTYRGHVVVDMNHGGRWIDGIAPAYGCVRCCREWTGTAEPLRRPLADVALARRVLR